MSGPLHERVRRWTARPVSPAPEPASKGCSRSFLHGFVPFAHFDHSLPAKLLIKRLEASDSRMPDTPIVGPRPVVGLGDGFIQMIRGRGSQAGQTQVASHQDRRVIRAFGQAS